MSPGGVPTKNVNDNACLLGKRGALRFFVGTPPGDKLAPTVKIGVRRTPGAFYLAVCELRSTDLAC
ncbi:hypothetical protein FIV38_10950 [Pseudomonas proteolytica]|nr:hypothetical protein F4W61_18225 [Pseudomonas proteolytica]TWR83350.1 hypothetical protein FIV38_10950 [Pseudomonas proteolytica]